MCRIYISKRPLGKVIDKCISNLKCEFEVDFGEISQYLIIVLIIPIWILIQPIMENSHIVGAVRSVDFSQLSIRTIFNRSFYILCIFEHLKFINVSFNEYISYKLTYLFYKFNMKYCLTITCDAQTVIWIREVPVHRALDL